VTALTRALLLTTLWAVACGPSGCGQEDGDTQGEDSASDSPAGDSPVGDSSDDEIDIVELGPLVRAVEFATTQACEGEVRFGRADSDRRFFVREGSPLREHRVLVPGLRPGEHYEGVVTCEGTAVEAPFTIETGAELPLPSGVPDPLALVRLRTRVTCPRPDLLEQESHLLTNIAFPQSNGRIAQALLWDREGVPIWTHIAAEEHQGSGDVDVSFGERCEAPYLENDACLSVLIGGGIPERSSPVEVAIDHATLHAWGPQPSMGKDGYTHHAFAKAGDDYLTMSSQQTATGENSDWLVLHDETFDPSEDPEAGVLWDAVIKEDIGSFEYFSNSLVMTEDGGTIAFFSRSTNLLVGIDRDTRSVAWAFGPGASKRTWADGVVAIDDFQGATPDWFHGAHGSKLRRHNEDQLDVLMHDNGVEKPESGVVEGEYTRAIAYRIDVVEGTVERLWAYPDGATEDQALLYLDSNWGDIEWHGDNVLLFSSAYDQASYNGLPQRTVITEIRPDEQTGTAELVWRMELEAESADGDPVIVGLYGGDVLEGLRGIAEAEAFTFANDGSWRSFDFVR
jgi:hypothetical protein